MHGQLKPQQIEMLIGSGPIREEFSQKIKEIDRRLKMNGMNYRQWDTLTDHQQGIFIDNLFLTGDCATSPEHYVQGAVKSCGCPDTEEDLHHHSPVLMREIEKQQEMLPDVTVKISESLGFVNEFIDRQVAGLTFLTEASKKVQAYEQLVVDALEKEGIQGSMPEAHADATGPDAEFVIDGEPYYLEIKLNTKAQMGDKAVGYSPKTGKFTLNKKAYDPEVYKQIGKALKAGEKGIKDWLEALRDPARPASMAWEKDNINALNWKTTSRKFFPAQEAGLQNAASFGYGAGKEKIELPSNFVNKMYNSKDIYYIQIGGKGLYYMGEDKANLFPPDVGEFGGEITLELRPRANARDKINISSPSQEATAPDGTTFVLDYEPDLDAEGNMQWQYNAKGKLRTREHAVTKDRIPMYVRKYKGHQSAVEGDEEVFWVSGFYGATARLQSKDLVPSPYNMDNPASIQKMLQDRAARLGQEEAPTEPEELESELEPQESEGL
tara:strand:+ start:600 stop:2084 length:1485 start_codon:yes stop_codon:yes gene_type:complete